MPPRLPLWAGPARGFVNLRTNRSPGEPRGGRAHRMSENVSQYILRRMHEEWDVRRIYGYPGDGINGLLGAFHEHGDEIEFVQVRHEELAAFMATARATRTCAARRRCSTPAR